MSQSKVDQLRKSILVVKQTAEDLDEAINTVWLQSRGSWPTNEDHSWQVNLNIKRMEQAVRELVEANKLEAEEEEA